ncbi:transmembrane protein 238 [Huso huso]|uniref:Transmembrane protein 238 n=1 Tax=Huso huso TaxID=61971 RepID=A0ABR0Z0G7_HUSHU|nr:transmembrane protein 238-like [Acipenser ruthenus]
MGCSKIVGRCFPIFVIAIVFDVVGIVLLLLGIFAHFTFWDFFIYTGAIIISLSLIFWICWYSVNLEPSEELRLA